MLAQERREAVCFWLPSVQGTKSELDPLELSAWRSLVSRLEQPPQGAGWGQKGWRNRESERTAQ